MRETCLLTWDSEEGFQLELHAGRGGIVVQLVTVALDADGTDELGARAIELARMDMLFKAQVMIEGNPGQIQKASVQLVENGRPASLRLVAELEDAESGMLYPLDWTLMVFVPEEAPRLGGPRPKMVEEDDLDWDDETTMEQVLIDVPPVDFGDGDNDDEDDLDLDFDGDDDDAYGDDEDREEAPVRGGGRQAGSAALLRALASLEDESSDPPTDFETPPVTRPYVPSADDRDLYADDEPSGVHRLAVPRTGAKATPAPAPVVVPPEASDRVLSETEEALSLLKLLEGQEHIELEDDRSVDELVSGVVRILARHRGAEAQAAALSAWLIEQDAVLDLYIDDDSLAEILETW